MKVALDEITGVGGRCGQAAERDGKLPGHAAGTPGGEINVIGMTVEEATGRLDKFLDDAALANRSQVRIIHGHGTGGASQRDRHVSFASHPLVEKHSFENGRARRKSDHDCGAAEMRKWKLEIRNWDNGIKGMEACVMAVSGSARSAWFDILAAFRWPT